MYMYILYDIAYKELSFLSEDIIEFRQSLGTWFPHDKNCVYM